MKKYNIPLLLIMFSYCYGVDECGDLKVENCVVDQDACNLSYEELFENGNSCFRAQDYKKSVHFFKKALQQNPTCAHTYFNLGQAYFWQDKYQKALDCYKKTIFYQPSHQHAYAQIGRLLYEVKQYKDAVHPLKKALELNPHVVDTYLTLARSYSQLHRFDDAVDLLKKALKKSPQDINLMFELANVYNHQNNLQEALLIYQLLNNRVPNNASILYNIGFTLKKLGRTRESLEYYDKALEINPHHYDALFSRGLAYLVLGDFENGWQGYEWRYHRPDQGCLRSCAGDRWDGSDLTDKTILLHAEQGLGDTFQFIRYAKLIKETKNPKKIIAAVQKPLVTLLELCPYLDAVTTVDDTTVAFDVHAPLMSLPYIVKTTIKTIPSSIPYLYARTDLVNEWKEKLSQDTHFKVGICVQGNQNYATPQLQMTVALKSVGVEKLKPLSLVPGVSLYSLQKMTGTQQFDNLSDSFNIITFDGDFDNSHGRFMDTVAVMKNLDLVITVDTSIAHLAAALAIPTWIMLPNPADWRWMENRLDSPWYKTVRLFKQPTPGDWDSMIENIAQELSLLVSQRQNMSIIHE